MGQKCSLILVPTSSKTRVFATRVTLGLHLAMVLCGARVLIVTMYDKEEKG